MAEMTASQALQDLLVTCIVFLVLDPVFVALRFVSCHLIKRQRWAVDDVLIVAGLVANIGLCATYLVIYHYETMGNQPADLAIEDECRLKPIMKAIYIAEQLLYASFSLPKLSLFCVYLRVLDFRWIRCVTWGSMGVIMICWLIFTLVAAFSCQPVAFFWDSTVSGGHCIDVDPFWRVKPPFNILTDIVAMVVPIPFVWKLHASRLQKMSIIFVFLTGGIGLIACCIRWRVYFKFHPLPIIPRTSEPLILWAVIECSMYQIAACLPLLKPLAVAVMPTSLLETWRSWTGWTGRPVDGHIVHNAPRSSTRVLGSQSSKSFQRMKDEEDIVSTDSPASTEPCPARAPAVASTSKESGECIEMKDLSI